MTTCKCDGLGGASSKCVSSLCQKSRDKRYGRSDLPVVGQGPWAGEGLKGSPLHTRLATNACYVNIIYCNPRMTNNELEGLNGLNFRDASSFRGKYVLDVLLSVMKRLCSSSVETMDRDQCTSASDTIELQSSTISVAMR